MFAGGRIRATNRAAEAVPRRRRERRKTRARDYHQLVDRYFKQRLGRDVLEVPETGAGDADRHVEDATGQARGQIARTDELRARWPGRRPTATTRRRRAMSASPRLRPGLPSGARSTLCPVTPLPPIAAFEPRERFAARPTAECRFRRLAALKEQSASRTSMPRRASIFPSVRSSGPPSCSRWDSTRTADPQVGGRCRRAWELFDGLGRINRLSRPAPGAGGRFGTDAAPRRGGHAGPAALRRVRVGAGAIPVAGTTVGLAEESLRSEQRPMRRQSGPRWTWSMRSSRSPRAGRSLSPP